MATRTFHPDSHANDPEVLPYASARPSPPAPRTKLRPASHSYLNRASEAAVIGVIFGIAAALLAAKFWLIRLLG